LTDPNEAVPREVGEVAAAADLRARLNDELGFYPARLDEESIAEYRREDSEDRERHARYVRKHGGPGGSHWNQFRHLVKNRESGLARSHPRHRSPAVLQRPDRQGGQP